MKKLLLGTIAALVITTSAAIAVCHNFDGIYDSQQVVYKKTSQTWDTGGMSEDRIVLTKKTSSGSVSYSQYYYDNGKLAFEPVSNFEFIKDGMLVAVNNSSLKYSKIVYDHSKFKSEPLTCEELKKAFPDAEIIKISQFDNGKYTVKKRWFVPKTLLLINDTDKDFYKYSYKPSSVQKTDITGLIRLTRHGKVIFSHYGDEADKYTIYVK